MAFYVAVEIIILLNLLLAKVLTGKRFGGHGSHALSQPSSLA